MPKEKPKPSKNICPLLNRGCLKNDCALFYHFEKKPPQAGHCAILHIGVLMSALNGNVVNIAAKGGKNLRELGGIPMP